MLKSVVYFEEVRGLNRVRIGFSSKPKNRRQTHRSNGMRRLAALPGTFEDEQALHRDLRQFRVDSDDCGNDSTYEGTPVVEYVSWLVARGYAHVDDARIEKAPLLPYDIWRFDNRGHAYEEHDGQLRLSREALEPFDRIVMESTIATKSSLSDDWYTPRNVIEMARSTMGSIDTDPASCLTANEWINAPIWYCREIDGLALHNPWRGKVWLNPPYGRGEYSAKAFIRRLQKEYLLGSISEAITCLNSDSTTSLWFEPVWQTATIHLIWRGRLNFIAPTKEAQASSPMKGTIFSYFGRDATSFKRNFGPYGHLVVKLGE